MSAAHETDFLSWERGAARVVNFATAARKGSTILKIEIAVTSPWELGDLMRDLMRLKTAGEAAPATLKKVEQE